MPKYQTYGQYDTRKDEFPESAEKVLRAGEESAVMSGADGNSGDNKKFICAKNGDVKGAKNYPLVKAEKIFDCMSLLSRGEDRNEL